MKTIKLIGLLAIVFLLAQCKSTAPTGVTPPTPSLLEVTSILDSAQSHFIQYVNWNGGDPWKAIQLTADWLELQPNVSSAFTLDSIHITIQLKSGLETYFNFEQVDDSGYSVLRGGGGIPDDAVGANKAEVIINPRRSASVAPATNTITNKKVLLFEAGSGSLNVEPQIKRTLAWINNSGLGLDVTVLRGIQCSAGVVPTFQNYGLVILDTHGVPDAFQVGSHLDLSSTPLTDAALKSLVDAQVGAGTSSDLASGNLKIGASVKGNPAHPNWQKAIDPSLLREFMYSSKALDLLPPMPNTIVFGNMCLGGFTASSGTRPERTVTFPDGSTHHYPANNWTIDGPMGLSFISKGLISYYAYARDLPPNTSRSVPDDFAIRMEDSLVHRLMQGDSTRIANLASDNKTEFFDPEHPVEGLLGSLYLRHFGSDNYSYSPCVDTFTDARDGHLYHAVCIGKQSWMSENLDYYVPGSKCYDSLASNCDTYGLIYPWKAAMAGASASDAVPSGVQGICPKGWHLPSAAEWTILFNNLGGAQVAGGAMKSTSPLWSAPNVGATNSSGFSALPAGNFIWFQYAIDSPYVRYHEGLDIHTYFLSSSIQASDNTVIMYALNQLVGGVGLYRDVSTDMDPYSPPGNASCRCVKDP
jgi:uncharacterized protein (TIGR02145 family)